MPALGWHASACMALVWRLVRHAAVRLADVLLGVGVQPEHRRLEHGQRSEHEQRMTPCHRMQTCGPIALGGASRGASSLACFAAGACLRSADIKSTRNIALV